ncbi:response regulator [Trinickia caryophylli]|uniref:Response regulator receiver domain-containing protein n=1 Tax=Trinickia caryophylli TaxID=28094 RepID=A0A1X7EUS0_TRICW|nr:response regulator [Trinickia caryophylli]PMS12186.1 response regulator [Trinickia caryophylli]TRX18506.1 response regulator [Trinickia caryophylli]WQE10705.1 response regulator [Trinickia caryophylli]SMF40626.1 Response regulator receiver domain-containing protein [Trinickia caryophylli]GLU33077.1 transcriptional regulator [Trinickia caryophylli]
MGLPVLVVDDSTLARRLLINALPEAWDVELTQAANGNDALAAYRSGRASVMFLDLTMPGMTGFDVLEAVRADGLDSFVIVVSADIQPEAKARVKALGAVAFIEKPVSSEKILPVLKEYGLYE